MGVIVGKFWGKKKDEKYLLEREKDKILEYLNELQRLESKLWGIDIRNVKSGENVVLENTEHLIYLLSRGEYESLNKVLDRKDVKLFFKDLETIKKDFNVLKRELREKERLKLLISNFTIKLVDAQNYKKFKEVFLLEKRLYEVLDRQNDEIGILMSDLSKIRIDGFEGKLELFMKFLRRLQNILSGHLDNIKYFEEDRVAYSNTSNLIFELIRLFSQEID